MKSMALMFPKNHNNPVSIVVGEWDKKEKGKSYIEVNYPNAYLPKKYFNFKQHKTQKEMTEEIQKNVKYIEEINKNKVIDTTYESEQSFFITFCKGINMTTILTPSVPIAVLDEDEKTLITVMAKTEIDIKDKKFELAYIDVTNDPTLNIAGGVVSLGYYCWRFEMKDCICINTNPLQIVAKSENIRRIHGRPCRRMN